MRPALLARLLPPQHALDLALFRVLVVLAWVVTIDPRLAAHFALYPDELCFPPFVWNRLIRVVHVPEFGVWTAYAIFLGSSLAALLGWRARWALFVMLLSGGLVLTIPQFFGKVNHTNHLVWFVMLLIASPCADALSLDARRRARAGIASSPSPSHVYSVPLLLSVLLVGLAYLVPGLRKLQHAGLAWGNAEHLIGILHVKWLEFDAWTPWPRIDRFPLLCGLAGKGALAFEILFLPLACWRRTRPLVIVLGLLFHLGTLWFMRIALWHMAIAYAALVPWHALLARRGLRAARAADRDRVHTAHSAPRRSPWPCTIVGGMLLAGNLYNGLLERDDWPLGAYPSFAWTGGDRLPMLLVRATMPDGTTRDIPESMLSRHSTPERARSLANAILLPHPRRDARLMAYWLLLTRLDPSLATASDVSFDVIEVATNPDSRERVVARRTILQRELPVAGMTTAPAR